METLEASDMTIENKLNELIQVKEDIKSSIEAKGVAVGDIPLAEYSDKIEAIETTPQRGILIKENGEKMEMYVDGDSMLGLLGDSGGNSKVKRLELISTTGVPITNIPANAFNGYSNIVIEDLPETIKTIWSNAFNGCRKLGLSKIPDGVTSLGSTSFNFAGDLKITTLNNVDTLGSNVFQHARFLVEDLSMPKINSLTNFSFGNVNLKTVTIGSPGNPVTSIGVSTFNPTTSITNIFVYVSNPASPGLLGAPWGANGAYVQYLQA